jgi:hypothetical protein
MNIAGKVYDGGPGYEVSGIDVDSSQGLVQPKNSLSVYAI